MTNYSNDILQSLHTQAGHSTHYRWLSHKERNIIINLFFLQNRKENWISKALSCFIQNRVTIQECLNIPFRKVPPQPFLIIFYIWVTNAIFTNYLYFCQSHFVLTGPAEAGTPLPSMEEELKLSTARDLLVVQPRQTAL